MYARRQTAEFRVCPGWRDLPEPVSRPFRQFDDLPHEWRWEATRRHPYYQLLWRAGVPYGGQPGGDANAPAEAGGVADAGRPLDFRGYLADPALPADQVPAHLFPDPGNRAVRRPRLYEFWKELSDRLPDRGREVLHEKLGASLDRLRDSPDWADRSHDPRDVGQRLVALRGVCEQPTLPGLPHAEGSKGRMWGGGAQSAEEEMQ